MKKVDLVKQPGEMGCILIRHGGRHDWYQNPKTNVSQPVLRRNEIADILAKHILKMLSD
jgi:hypothetical protein